jgi:hypothetical protein
MDHFFEIRFWIMVNRLLTYYVIHLNRWKSKSHNILKIRNNSQGSLVLSSKAGAHRSVISERSPSHKIEGISRTYEIPLYCLTCPNVVLSVPVCREYTIVYTYKISELKLLLLKDSEIYNEWIPHFSWTFFRWGCLYCIWNMSTRERFEKLKFLAFS